MKKESLIAIVVGFGFGLTAALAILVLPRKISNLKIEIPFVSRQEKVPVRVDRNGNTPTVTVAPAKLVIAEPEDRSIMEKNRLTIRGTAAPDSLVTLLTINNTDALTTDAKGNFEFKTELVEGRNDIQIAAFPKGKKPETKTVAVYYIEK